MKPILPKGRGMAQVRGIFSSPRTTIFLAPAAAASSLPLGASFSSPLILPAPPTSTITLAAHRVPQPTPVMLPLTSKGTASSTRAHLHAPLLAPKHCPPRIALKNRLPTVLCSSGQGSKKCNRQENKKRKDNKQIRYKFSNSETPILPKRPQPDSQTVILLPSGPGRTVALPSTVLVPKGSLMISDRHSQTTTKEGKKTKSNKRNSIKNLSNKAKKQERVPPSSSDGSSTHQGNPTKAVPWKSSKKRCVENCSIMIGETSKITPSNTHQNAMREASSLPLGDSSNAVYSPESFILSAEEGYVNQSSHLSHRRDVPQHPPPPYPQDAIVDASSSSSNTKDDQDPSKALKDVSEPATCGPKLLHAKKKKCEWKHKRHTVAERLSNASTSVPLPGKKSHFSCTMTDVDDSHTSSPLSPGCTQPVSAATSPSSPSLDIPIGKTCVTPISSHVASSALQSHASLNKSRSMFPSTCKSHSSDKGPPYEPHTALPAASPSLDDAPILLLTSGKSFQSKSPEQSCSLSATSLGICVADDASGSSHPPGLSSPQPASHTPHCSHTPIVSHVSHSPDSPLSHEANTSIPSSRGVTYQPKSGTNAASSQASHQFTANTQHAQTSVSLHSTVCDQVSSPTFYYQPPQCSSGLQAVLQSHPTTSSIETNAATTPSFSSYIPSQDETFIHKVDSHSSSYTDAALSIRQSPHMESPHLSPYLQSSQPKFAAKSSPLPPMPSPQPPSYTQSSNLSSPSQAAQAATSTLPDPSPSPAYSSPSAAHDASQTSYLESPHPQSCLSVEHTSYPPPTPPLPLCGESQDGRIVSSHHSPQGMDFSEYTPSYHPSPHADSHSQPFHKPPVSVENFSAIAMLKDHSQSPVLPLYSASHDVSSSQCYTDSSNISYTSEQTNAHDLHYYSIGKIKPISSSSTDVSSSHFILEKSLNPPSYEAHIQNNASYIASGSSDQVTQDDSQSSHHQNSPTNYSLSCHVVRDQGTQSLHEDAKRIACSSPSPLLSLTSSPRYTYSQQLTHEDPQIDHSIIADIAQGDYDYDIEESSEAYFAPTTPEAQLALPAERQPTSSMEYTATYSLAESQSTSMHANPYVQDSVQPRLPGCHTRVLFYPVTRQESPYKNSDTDAAGPSGWSAATRPAGHGDNLRLDKLLFIPHSDQSRLYPKKESSKTLSSDPGLHISKDMMLKKFWIEEDEPIAEEILSSLPSRLPATQTLPAKKDKVRQMLCQICGKMLRGRNSLRYHLNSHYNIQPHACSTCGKRFTNRSILVEHLRIHSGETPYLCSLCDAAFKTRSGLFRHRSTHTVARPFECSMCTKKFKSKLVLQHHMKLHLTDVFTCSDCGKTFERRKSLSVHRAFHHHKTQRFTCPHCPKGYHFQSMLKTHMQLHSNVLKHVCGVCRKAFVWRSGLAAHMKTHSASRSKCDLCDMHFASEKRLRSHYQQHTNPKPHQCKVCGKCFSHSYRLASHSLVHQEHKEYVCHRCNVEFTNAKKFRTHLVTHKKEDLGNCRLYETVEVSKTIS